jgi:predicted double-glycine peptidase
MQTMSLLDSTFHSDMNAARNLYSLVLPACVCACLVLTLPVAVAKAQDILPSPTTGYPSSSHTTRSSLLDFRFRNIVRQELDFSCGAAAMATLLTYYFGDPTPEAELLELIEKTLSAEENRQRVMTGFSLLDLKKAVNAKGYDAAGYRLSFKQLRQLATPVIVYVAPLGYKHFAVLRGVVGDRVWLADPSRGNLRMSTSRFREEWGGKTFVGVAFLLGREGESDIGLNPLSLSEMQDTLIDRHRMQSQLDIDDRLLRPIIALPASVLK